MAYDCWWSREFELKWLFFLDLSMVSEFMMMMVVDCQLRSNLRKCGLSKLSLSIRKIYMP
jgi:hypothetical protein